MCIHGSVSLMPFCSIVQEASAVSKYHIEHGGEKRRLCSAVEHFGYVCILHGSWTWIQLQKQHHTHICIHLHTYTYVHLHTYIYICIYKYIHTCTYTYIHTPLGAESGKTLIIEKNGIMENKNYRKNTLLLGNRGKTQLWKCLKK